VDKFFTKTEENLRAKHLEGVLLKHTAATVYTCVYCVACGSFKTLYNIKQSTQIKILGEEFIWNTFDAGAFEILVN